MAKDLPLIVQKEMWDDLEAIQETFPYTEEGFLDFSGYVIGQLIKGKPSLARSQADVCKYLFGGPQYRMIQASRGLGKTTLSAIYAVFRIIHDPTTRVLVFSAGGKMAKEIANWCIQIITGIEILHCLLPDRNNGDRASVEGFDIHWVYRGAEKAPSIKCLGVDSNAQGSRADLIIADDIESLKNSRTVMMKELLVELTKEFESINQNGDILYLGTPQFVTSIYTAMPSRGYDVRIWTGRYPTPAQTEAYGNRLAPMFIQDLDANPELGTGGGVDGKSGQPTIPEMYTEEMLQQKEISQGPSKFQLQFMLNTSLSDSERYPLKLNSLIVAPFNKDSAPVQLIHSKAKDTMIEGVHLFSNQPTDTLHYAVPTKYEVRPFDRILMYIDPAGGGQNGDETGYAVIALQGSVVYVLACGGVPGGYEKKDMIKLMEIAKRYDVREVYYEKNYGNGAWAAIAAPIFQEFHPVDLKEDWATGQKEVRIIDTLEPLIASHRLVLHPDVIENDLRTVGKYATSQQATYSMLFQMSMLTRDKGCLVHDDRLDGLAGAVRQITLSIAFNNDIELEAKRHRELQEWTARVTNPQNYREDVGVSTGSATLGCSFGAKGW